MKQKHYAWNGKTYAVIEGKTEDGKFIFTVYYDGWFAKRECHTVHMVDDHFGYFRPSKYGTRILFTI